MSRRPEIAPEGDELIEREAEKRAACLTNKQIAERTGQSLRYIANRIAHVRRRIEIRLAPRETSDKSEDDEGSD